MLKNLESFLKDKVIWVLQQAFYIQADQQFLLGGNFPVYIYMKNDKLQCTTPSRSSPFHV